MRYREKSYREMIDLNELHVQVARMITQKCTVEEFLRNSKVNDHMNCTS